LCKEIADILRQIADKIETGTMTLMQSGNETILDFPQSDYRDES